MLKLYSNIKQRRTEIGMSQEELAKKVGYSGRSMIAKIEAGKIDLYQSKIDEIAKALETTSAILMGYTENEKSNYTDTDGEYNEFNYNMLMKLLSERKDCKKNITIDSDTIEEMWRVENNNIFAVTECMGTIRDKSTFAINTLQNFCDEFKIGGKFDYNSIERLEADDLHDLSNYLDKILDVISDIPYLDIHYETPVSNNNIKDTEYKFITKYNALNNHGKEVVDFILEKEYQNSKAKEFNTTTTRLVNYYYKLASAGTGQIIFDTPPTKSIEIPDTYKNVDYAIGVNGDSMEPMYSDGDTLLVQMSSDVDIGEIGIFQIDGQCYVKKLGNGELISVNTNYDNIPLNESSTCMGKVIGKL